MKVKFVTSKQVNRGKTVCRGDGRKYEYEIIFSQEVIFEISKEKEYLIDTWLRRAEYHETTLTRTMKPMVHILQYRTEMKKF